MATAKRTDFFRQSKPKASPHAPHGEGSLGERHVVKTRHLNPARSADGNATGVGTIGNAAKPYRLGGG